MPRRLTRRGKILAIGLPIGVLVVAFLLLYALPRCLVGSLGGLPPRMQRLVLHTALLFPGGNLHDAYIDLIRVGDESSVPFLIRSLKWHPRSPDGSMVCTKGHCLEALERITNNNPGYEYEDWKRWWRENRRKTRQEWIFDGFRAAGPPVSDPPDDAFICVLMGALIGNRGHLREHARSILDGVPRERLLACADQAMTSSVPDERGGAVLTVAQIGGPGAVERLRCLTTDVDPRVARRALTFLNEALRRELPSCHEQCLIWQGNFGQAVGGLSPGTTTETVRLTAWDSGTRRGATSILEFSLVEKKVVRSERLPPVPAGSQEVSGNRIFVACDDGFVRCFDATTGASLWEREKERPAPPRARRRGRPSMLHPAVSARLRVMGEGVTVLDDGFLWAFDWAFDQTDGITLWSFPCERVTTTLDAGGGTVYAITQTDELLSISVAGDVLERTAIDGRAHSISAHGDTVCVISGGDQARLTCYEAPSMAVRWQQRVQETSSPPLIDESSVIVGTSVYCVAFDRLSGARLWMSVDGAKLSPLPVGNRFVMLNAQGRLEVRSKRTGEVLCVFNEPVLERDAWLSVCGDLTPCPRRA